jgi:hypothetical protein
MCIYTYIYRYMPIHRRASIGYVQHINTYIYIHVYKHTCVYTHIYTATCLFIGGHLSGTCNTSIHIFIYMYIYTHVYAHIYMPLCAYRSEGIYRVLTCASVRNASLIGADVNHLCPTSVNSSPGPAKGYSEYSRMGYSEYSRTEVLRVLTHGGAPSTRKGARRVSSSPGPADALRASACARARVMFLRACLCACARVCAYARACICARSSARTSRARARTRLARVDRCRARGVCAHIRPALRAHGPCEYSEYTWVCVLYICNESGSIPLERRCARPAPRETSQMGVLGVPRA